MYRDFQSPSELSEAIARQWGIDYAACGDDLPHDAQVEGDSDTEANRYRIH